MSEGKDMNVDTESPQLVDKDDINKLIDDKADPGDLFDFDRDQKSPCWEVKIGDEKLSFMIDRKEKVSVPISKVDVSAVTMVKINEWIQMLRKEDYKAISKDVKGSVMVKK